jgi:tRNA nucleotidyltransferase/poly(A) polymerase
MEVRRLLKIALHSDVLSLAMLFASNGYELYLVGGAVRDAVMGKAPKDFDLATNARPDQVEAMLHGTNLWMTDEVGKAFGVIRTRRYTPDGSPSEEYEIATFREDMSMGRHPTVRFATIKEDVQRRDLTINALFYDISKEEVVDLVGGLADIDDGIIRTVGRPEDRFAEDRLRVMRAIRFAVKLGFKIESETYQAIIRDNNLDGVSFERVRDELVRSISGARSSKRLMRLMDELNMWDRVLPGLKASPCLDSLVSTRGIDSNNVPVVLALLLDGEDPETVGKRLNHLKYSAEEVAQVTFLLRLRDLTKESAPKLRKAFRSTGLSPDDVIEYVRARGLPDRVVFAAFLSYLSAEPYRGEPLMAQGFSGKALGMELQRLESELFQSLVTT